MSAVTTMVLQANIRHIEPVFYEPVGLSRLTIATGEIIPSYNRCLFCHAPMTQGFGYLFRHGYKPSKMELIFSLSACQKHQHGLVARMQNFFDNITDPDQYAHLHASFDNFCRERMPSGVSLAQFTVTPWPYEHPLLFLYPAFIRAGIYQESYPIRPVSFTASLITKRYTDLWPVQTIHLSPMASEPCGHQCSVCEAYFDEPAFGYRFWRRPPYVDSEFLNPWEFRACPDHHEVLALKMSTFRGFFDNPAWLQDFECEMRNPDIRLIENQSNRSWHFILREWLESIQVLPYSPRKAAMHLVAV